MAQDHIVPHRSRMEVPSESARQALALRRMGGDDDGLEEADKLIEAAMSSGNM